MMSIILTCLLNNKTEYCIILNMYKSELISLRIKRFLDQYKLLDINFARSMT